MRVVRAVSMSPESVEIAYLDDTSDFRGDGGSVYQVHTVCVRLDDPELEEAVTDLETAVTAFLTAAVTRWATSPPVSPEEALQRELDRYQPDDDDDDEDEDDGR